MLVAGPHVHELALVARTAKHHMEEAHRHAPLISEADKGETGLETIDRCAHHGLRYIATVPGVAPTVLTIQHPYGTAGYLVRVVEQIQSLVVDVVSVVKEARQCPLLWLPEHPYELALVLIPIVATTRRYRQVSTAAQRHTLRTLCSVGLHEARDEHAGLVAVRVIDHCGVRERWATPSDKDVRERCARLWNMYPRQFDWVQRGEIALASGCLRFPIVLPVGVMFKTVGCMSQLEGLPA